MKKVKNFRAGKRAGKEERVPANEHKTVRLKAPETISVLSEDTPQRNYKYTIQDEFPVLILAEVLGLGTEVTKSEDVLRINGEKWKCEN